MRIAGFVGSLREGSLNRSLFEALRPLLPAGAELVEVTYSDFPLYNPDLGQPESVTRALEEVKGADAVLIVTPEFNYGIPGPLKNALDWLSRPAYQSVFAHRPITMLGASPGPIGTARAQGQLKQVLLGMAALIFPHPEIAIGLAKNRFDESGQLTDERSKELLSGFLEKFTQFVEQSRA